MRRSMRFGGPRPPKGGMAWECPNRAADAGQILPMDRRDTSMMHQGLTFPKGMSLKLTSWKLR